MALKGHGVHGGDVYNNKVTMDFSVNVNPYGMPESVRHALSCAIEKCGQYPDMSSQELVNEISRRTGIPAECTLCGNGASELLMAAVQSLMPSEVLIPVPSFYGYERAAKSAGSRIVYYQMQETESFCLTDKFTHMLTQDVDMLILATPNNPAGNMINAELMEKICDICKAENITLLIDESFIEFTGRKSFIEEHDLSDYPHMAVIRSFTKIYAIPGVRLGFMLCGSDEMCRSVAERLPEWNISVFAQEAGMAALCENDYISRTVINVANEREFMIRAFTERGMQVFPGTANFLLFQGRPELYGELLDRGILIRDCSNFRGLSEGFFRVAVKTHEENVKLFSILDGLNLIQRDFSK